jgi:hypothetical protein
MWPRGFGARGGGRRRPGLADTAALAAFLAREASLISQKTVISYCHAKTRLPMNELMREARFVEAYERSRSEAYAAILGDLAAVVEARLRAAAGGRAGDLAAALARVHARILAAQPRPAHRPDGWADADAAFAERLRTLQLAPPHAIADLAAASGRRVFETLPIHKSLRWYDEDPVIASVQFMMVSLASRLDAELDAPALVEDLLREERAPG